jgi:hypothetical protein
MGQVERGADRDGGERVAVRAAGPAHEASHCRWFGQKPLAVGLLPSRESLNLTLPEPRQEQTGFRADTCLLLDESGYEKKGKDPAGVARQWCGRLGKVENCQVGVFVALCHGQRYIPIDARLCLPKEWTQNRRRCREAGIPDEKIVPCSKAEHALAMVTQARADGVRFAWVGLDGGYGKTCPRA